MAYDQPYFEPKKASQVIHLIIHKSQNDPHFCYLKLWMILFHADMKSWRQRGISISTFTYIKHPLGPIPKPSQFNRAMKLLNAVD